MTRRKIRYGIISTASIAPRFTQAMKCTDNGEVVAVSSRSIEKARKFAEVYDIPDYYDDYEVLLHAPEIDAVYLPLVNSLHYEFARKALEAGRHVVMEKPFVLYPWQGEELRKLSEERGLFIAEAVKTLFLPVHLELKKRIDSGMYGKIHMMEFRQSYAGGGYAAGWNRMRECGGGALYGNEAYFFSMAEMYGGKILDLNGSATYGDSDAEDQFALTVTMENNILATCAVSRKVQFDNNGMEIWLDKAHVSVPDYWKAREAYVYQNGELVETLSYPCNYELMYELQHFNECIEKGLTESPVIPVSASIRHAEFCRKLYDEWEK